MDYFVIQSWGKLLEENRPFRSGFFVCILRCKINFALSIQTKKPDTVRFFFGRDDWIRTSDP